jgi:hypothetical protein
MEVLPQELVQTLEQYEEMQALHYQQFSDSRDHTPDMNRLNFQRARTFENLKVQLLSHRRKFDCSGNEADRELIGRRLRKIIDTEKVIAHMAAGYRETVMERKRLIQQGKKALKGYGAMCAG